MAHMIDESAGRAAVFVVGEPAWHGLGIVIDAAVTAQEAIGLAGLDWEVEKWKLNALSAAGDYQVGVDNWYATVRTDTNGVLGVVSEKYKVMQNRAAFGFMDKAIQEGAAMWETAGALMNGCRVWMLARFPDAVTVTRNDEVKPYALMAMGHDGGMAVHIMPTTTRVVCNNTLNLALSEGKRKELVIRHSHSLNGKLELARRHLGVIGQRVEEFQRQAQALARVSMKETEVRNYAEDFFPAKTRPDFTDGAALLDRIVNQQQHRTDAVRELLEGHFAETERIAKRNAEILDLILENHAADPARGTAWGAYNAVSQYVDHQARYKTAENRMNSVVFGAGDHLKQEAYSAALALAA